MLSWATSTAQHDARDDPRDLPAGVRRDALSFAGLVLVNTFVALFAGFMPVPGGMGVSEAALTAGLVASEPQIGGR